MPLIVPDRDAIATLGRRQWGIRHKQAGGRPLDIGTRSLPWVITQFIADVLIPASAGVVRNYRIRSRVLAVSWCRWKSAARLCRPNP